MLTTSTSGHFQQAGLVGLDGVSHPGSDHHYGGVGGAGHVHLYLAHTDGLHHERCEAAGLEEPQRCRHGQSEPTRVASSCHRADECLAPGHAVHANAVAEYRPAAEWGRRIDGQHRGLMPAVGHFLHQVSHEGGLARARSSGDANHGGFAAGQESGPLAEFVGLLAAALDHAEQPAQRPSLPGECPFQQLDCSGHDCPAPVVALSLETPAGGMRPPAVSVT